CTDHRLAAVRRHWPREAGGLRAAQGLPRQCHPRGGHRCPGAAQFAGHAHAGRPGRRPARPRSDVGLPDRWPWPVRLGPRHGRGAPPPGSLRIPARLRARAAPADAGPLSGRTPGAQRSAHATTPIASAATLARPHWRSAMSRLRIFADAAPGAALLDTSDGDAIARELGAIGVTFERWQANRPIAAGASQDEVLAAYRADIDRISAERGFTTVDVVSIAPDNPKRDEMRKTFLDEHFHKEDEVRFFVAGSGLFVLHVDERVYEIECVRNDLIAVPDGTTHWFDMGPEPEFV